MSRFASEMLALMDLSRRVCVDLLVLRRCLNVLRVGAFVR